MKTVSVMMPEAYTNGLDELVRAGMYPNRSAAIRTAIRDLLKTEVWKKGKKRKKKPRKLM